MVRSFKTKCALIFFALSLVIFSGCAVTRKISAAEILSNTKLEFASLSLDSVSINKDLFPKTGIMNGILPNPQVIALVQDFARGILNKELGYLGLSAEVIANNQSKDTLWIRNLQANMKLDSVMELPIALKDSIKMVPGENHIILTTTMPIDKRVFKLQDVSTINMKGVLTVALDVDGTPIPLDFNINRTVTQEEKVMLMDNARNSILKSIINDWVGAFGIEL